MQTVQVLLYIVQASFPTWHAYVTVVVVRVFLRAFACVAIHVIRIATHDMGNLKLELPNLVGWGNQSPKISCSL